MHVSQSHNVTSFYLQALNVRLFFEPFREFYLSSEFSLNEKSNNHNEAMTAQQKAERARKSLLKPVNHPPLGVT